MMIEKELLERIERETGIDYEAYDVIGSDDDKTYLPTNNIETLIKDLLIEIDTLKEKIEDIEEDMRENYKPIPPEDECEIYNGLFR